MAVVGAGGGFGVVLDRKDRAVLDSQALVGAVEEGDVADLDVCGQGLGVDHEAVVLAGDLDTDLRFESDQTPLLQVQNCFR